MSDIFVALPSTTKEGVIFGKNADRPASEVQEVVYHAAEDHAAGSKLTVTYTEIDQTDHTNAIILSKSPWTWGAEMGGNDQGVCAGYTSVYTKLCSTDSGNKTLIPADLVRLVLERANSAESGVKILTSLLEEHGQGGRTCVDESLNDWQYHGSYLISDRKEAWVVDTAGKFWAAKQIKEGAYNISNAHSIHRDADLTSANLQDEAVKAGFWEDGNGSIDFSVAFGLAFPDIENPDQSPENRRRNGQQMLTKYTDNDRFSINDMFEILRNKEFGISMSGKLVTTGSYVSTIAPAGSDIPDCHWFTATPYPFVSVYKPIMFSGNVNLGVCTKSPTESEDKRHKLYIYHEKARQLMESGTAEGDQLIQLMKKLESRCVEDVEEFRQNYSDQNSSEVDDLFKDICETEIKFYM